jgi:hypothetical protein
MDTPAGWHADGARMTTEKLAAQIADAVAKAREPMFPELPALAEAIKARTARKRALVTSLAELNERLKALIGQISDERPRRPQ